MRLIIVRHGQTFSNLRKICIGHGDVKLTELGIKQAQLLGKRFQNEKIDVAYSSDLTRAKKTANEILKYHSDLKLNIDIRLRERFLGDYEGKPFPPHFNWSELTDTAENDEQLCLRLKCFVNEIYEKHKDKTVLFVSHAGSIKALITVLQNLHYSKLKNIPDLKNTSVSIFEIKDNKCNLEVFNCTKHLDDL